MCSKYHKMKRKETTRTAKNALERCEVLFAIGILIGFMLGLLYIYLLTYLKNNDDVGIGVYQHKHNDCIFNSSVVDKRINPNGKTEAGSYLEQNIKILCWVMTNPKNHQTKALAVNKTWGPRCDKLLFMSSVVDPVLNTIQLPVKEGRRNLWAKTKEAFKYVYKHNLDSYDWFLKADDDTYVIVENLKFMLSAYSPSMPIYFGSKFRAYINQGYMGGGAGYVLSKAALLRFVEDGLKNTTKCREENNGFEDVEMGLCMQNLGIIAGNSRDQKGQETFFSYQPELQLQPDLNKTQPWLDQFWYYQQAFGFNCCSDHAISFHYVLPIEMFMLDYLLYHVHPFGKRGSIDEDNNLPNKLTISEILTNLNQHKSNAPVTWNVTAEFGDYDYGYRFRYQKEPE